MLNLIHDQQYRHMNLSPGFTGIFLVNFPYRVKKVGFCAGKFLTASVLYSKNPTTRSQLYASSLVVNSWPLIG